MRLTNSSGDNDSRMAPREFEGFAQRIGLNVGPAFLDFDTSNIVCSKYLLDNFRAQVHLIDDFECCSEGSWDQLRCAEVGD